MENLTFLEICCDNKCGLCTKKMNSDKDTILCEDCVREINESQIHDIFVLFWIHYSFLNGLWRSKFVVPMLKNHLFRCSSNTSHAPYHLNEIKPALVHYKEHHLSENKKINESFIVERLPNINYMNFKECVVAMVYSFYVLEDYELKLINEQLGRIEKYVAEDKNEEKKDKDANMQ